jgi:uncharacterized protein (DUF342 family)
MNDNLHKPPGSIDGNDTPARNTGEKPAEDQDRFEGGLAFRNPGQKNDAAVEITVASDGMKAEASFYPSLGDGLPVNPEYVAELMARLGIVAGILTENIADATLQCNLDRRLLHGVVIAQGSEPIDEVPEHASLETRFRREGPIIDQKAQQVDFKEISSFIVVKAGETIATMVERRAGVIGCDVFGKDRDFRRRSVQSFAPGKNVTLKDGRLGATVDGLLTIINGRLDVDEVLLIRGAVDYHTGHIVFPGDVIIEGSVGDGFKIWSGGSVICKSTLDAFDVNVKNDLICTQGIIGRRRAQIRAGGELRAKFIQNCKAAVRGDIHVSAAIINSRVYTLGKLDLGDKGVLMGGEASAVHGIRCGRLGNQAYQHTTVRAGTDFTVQQKIDQANERLRMLAARARQIDEMATVQSGTRLDQAKNEIEKAMNVVRTMLSGLLESLDADDGAVIEVKSYIFPGVVVEICRVSIVIDERVKGCRFRLDKMAGKIRIEKI